MMNQKVALPANKQATEFHRGVVKDVRGNKSLVHFESRGISRWCNTSNLQKVT